MLIRDLWTTSTALDYLVLGETYNSPNLKKAALEFTVNNIKALMETPEYEDKAHDYPALFLQIFKPLVERWRSRGGQFRPFKKKKSLCQILVYEMAFTNEQYLQYFFVYLKNYPENNAEIITISE